MPEVKQFNCLSSVFLESAPQAPAAAKQLAISASRYECISGVREESVKTPLWRRLCVLVLKQIFQLCLFLNWLLKSLYFKLLFISSLCLDEHISKSLSYTEKTALGQENFLKAKSHLFMILQYPYVLMLSDWQRSTQLSVESSLLNW